MATASVLRSILQGISMSLCVLTLFHRCMHAKRARRSRIYPNEESLPTRYGVAPTAQLGILASAVDSDLAYPKRGNMAPALFVTDVQLLILEEERHMTVLRKLGVASGAWAGSSALPSYDRDMRPRGNSRLPPAMDIPSIYACQ